MRPSWRVGVVAGTGYELLVLLYRQVQENYGLPALELRPDLAMPPELRPAADRFFRGDIALGMNVIPVAQEHAWHSAAGLVAGLTAADPRALTLAMLRPPDASPAECRRRDEEVTRVLAGSSRHALLEALDAERFDPSAAAELLDDPGRSVRAFAELVARYGRMLHPHDAALHAPLAAEATRAQALLSDAGLDAAAAELFPQWHFHDLTTFDAVALIPSVAIAPFLSARVVTGQKASIVFPVSPDQPPPLESLAAGLRAIAHAQRLEILRLAAAAPITGQELARALGLSEPTVHHHTSLLRAAGLLTSNRDAHRVYHTVRPDALDALLDRIRRTLDR
jgi:DNA-binding transcriptional ArsR family regulator